MRGGSAAASETVEAYRILVEAGEPLTVAQIAERFPRTAYPSAACNAYREHKEKTDPTWLNGKGVSLGRRLSGRSDGLVGAAHPGPRFPRWAFHTGNQ